MANRERGNCPAKITNEPVNSMEAVRFRGMVEGGGGGELGAGKELSQDRQKNLSLKPPLDFFLSPTAPTNRSDSRSPVELGVPSDSPETRGFLWLYHATKPYSHQSGTTCGNRPNRLSNCSLCLITLLHISHVFLSFVSGQAFFCSAFRRPTNRCLSYMERKWKKVFHAAVLD